MTYTAHPYIIMPRPRLQTGDLLLRALEENDIETIRLWRNAQMDVLRQSEPITPEAQRAYFASTVWPETQHHQPKQILLGIERSGVLIGYGGLVHIAWAYQRAEVSFLLAPELELDTSTLAHTFTQFLELMQELAFQDLQLQRLTTETYAHRTVHIQGLERAGHQAEGRLRDHVLVDGQPTDALVHGILAKDWRDKQSKRRATGVLVTSASAKTPLIQALKAAAARCSEVVTVCAGDTDTHAPSQYASDSFWLMPPADETHLADLVRGCQERNISIILPTRDGELAFWARHAALFSEAGIQVIVSSVGSIALCRDKLAFAKFGQEAGLPIIPAATTPFTFDEPLVVKERFGSGSRGLGLALSRENAITHALDLYEPLFQPFIAGPEISIDAWATQGGEVLGVVLRHRDRVVSGESQVTTTFRDPALEMQASQLLKKLNLRGPVVMQAIVVAGQLHVIECNPRFGGASTASIATGLDSLYWSLQEALGHIATFEFNRRKDETRQIRLTTDRVIYGSDF
jgi:RimJ/RimL family protein N-acetyltransferase/predicted ATP-grasp superfamily ATP-dependent carboligase